MNEKKSAVARPWEQKFLGYSMNREKRRAIGCILRKLCEWKSVQILEAEYCANPAPNERIRKCSALVLPYSFMGRLFISVSKSQKRTFNVSIR
ncbi:hypothetical protein BEC62_03815 [Escherichia coli]|nr:hypothetical protein [Escherichia coli]OKT36119.1 hypothetical protein ACN66_02700 [Escherichia coli]OKT42988.1 hypothetical protein ACN63_09485 [Escherichia coli]OKT56984.1 hypothetical protein ACN64_03430 [Escherichia coli]OKV81839.1 hypothetical protein AWP60_02760 [Escherichia coli]